MIAWNAQFRDEENRERLKSEIRLFKAKEEMQALSIEAHKQKNLELERRLNETAGKLMETTYELDKPSHAKELDTNVGLPNRVKFVAES